MIYEEITARSHMSPEQLAAIHPGLTASDADLDTRSDLYALGVVLWELLTGTIPFDDELGCGESGQSLQAMIDRRNVGIDPKYQDQLPPDTPAMLRHTLLTCLAPDPADRYATGAELADQLELSQDRTARDLVDPPTNSLRARLRMRPMPVVTLSSIFGQLLAGLYMGAHNIRLVEGQLGPAAAGTMTRLGLMSPSSPIRWASRDCCIGVARCSWCPMGYATAAGSTRPPSPRPARTPSPVATGSRWWPSSGGSRPVRYS
ncbi:protein kinase [Nocardia miyunensis]|uniref:protein kinase n=1 Tax=Nocardia miyunensis TaxID=282684 RepID=UPI00082ABA1B|nr:protein kinase [Nocardia miyunensis]